MPDAPPTDLLAPLAEQYRPLALAIVWDIQEGGDIVDSPNATKALTDRLMERGVELPGKADGSGAVDTARVKTILEAMEKAGLVKLFVAQRRTRSISAAWGRKKLPPCPFDTNGAPTQYDPVDEAESYTGTADDAVADVDAITVNLDGLSPVDTLNLVVQLLSELASRWEAETEGVAAELTELRATLASVNSLTAGTNGAPVKGATAAGMMAA